MPPLRYRLADPTDLHTGDTVYVKYGRGPDAKYLEATFHTHYTGAYVGVVFKGEHSISRIPEFRLNKRR